MKRLSKDQNPTVASISAAAVKKSFVVPPPEPPTDEEEVSSEEEEEEEEEASSEEEEDADQKAMQAELDALLAKKQTMVDEEKKAKKQTMMVDEEKKAKQRTMVVVDEGKKGSGSIDPAEMRRWAAETAKRSKPAAGGAVVVEEPQKKKKKSDAAAVMSRSSSSSEEEEEEEGMLDAVKELKKVRTKKGDGKAKTVVYYRVKSLPTVGWDKQDNRRPLAKKVLNAAVPEAQYEAIKKMYEVSPDDFWKGAKVMDLIKTYGVAMPFFDQQHARNAFAEDMAGGLHAPGLTLQQVAAARLLMSAVFAKVEERIKSDKTKLVLTEDQQAQVNRIRKTTGVDDTAREELVAKYISNLEQQAESERQLMLARKDALKWNSLVFNPKRPNHPFGKKEWIDEVCDGDQLPVYETWKDWAEYHKENLGGELKPASILVLPYAFWSKLNDWSTEGRPLRKEIMNHGEHVYEVMPRKEFLILVASTMRGPRPPRTEQQRKRTEGKYRTHALARFCILNGRWGKFQDFAAHNEDLISQYVKKNKEQKARDLWDLYNMAWAQIIGVDIAVDHSKKGSPSRQKKGGAEEEGEEEEDEED